MGPSNMTNSPSDYFHNNESSIKISKELEYEEYYNSVQQLSLQLIIIFGGYGVMIVALLGTIGNLLSIVILLQPRMRVTSINILLLGLQICDLLFVIVVALSEGVPIILLSINPNHNYLKYYFPFVSVIGYSLKFMFGLCSRYFTILVTIERYIAVCYPLKAASWLSARRSVYGSLIVSLFTIVFSIPVWFASTVIYDKENSRYIFTETEYYSSSFYQNYYFYTSSVVTDLVPFTTLIILNTAIVIQIRKFRAARSLIRSNNNDEGNSLTFLLFAIVFLFFVSNFFQTVSDFALRHYDRLPIWLLYISPFNSLFLVLNFSINFIFYCAFASRFRMELRKLFCNFTCMKSVQ